MLSVNSTNLHKKNANDTRINWKEKINKGLMLQTTTISFIQKIEQILQPWNDKIISVWLQVLPTFLLFCLNQCTVRWFYHLSMLAENYRTLKFKLLLTLKMNVENSYKFFLINIYHSEIQSFKGLKIPNKSWCYEIRMIYDCLAPFWFSDLVLMSFRIFL